MPWFVWPLLSVPPLVMETAILVVLKKVVVGMIRRSGADVQAAVAETADVIGDRLREDLAATLSAGMMALQAAQKVSDDRKA